MSFPSAVVCREVFDENSQPSAEEISEYATQIGIDPESESFLLPLAKDGLMKALPPPWKAYYDEKLQTHYYYNDETKKTQWEHPLDDVYRELVKKARDSSVLDDTCASVQELLTSEEYTKHLERVETKVESDEELTTDSDNNQSDAKEALKKRFTPLGRPPVPPLSKTDKRLSDFKISSLRRNLDNPIKPHLIRNSSEKEFKQFERPKMLFKQQSEIIDLKIHVLDSPEEDNFSPLLGTSKIEKGFPLTGKGSIFLKTPKSDIPSPDTEKSLPLDSMTKSDPPKGILREKISDTILWKPESVSLKARPTSSLEEDKKSVRFQLENVREPTVSPGSDSSERNEEHSIISAQPTTMPSPTIPSSPIKPVDLKPLTLNPLRSSVPLSPITKNVSSHFPLSLDNSKNSITSIKHSFTTNSTTLLNPLNPISSLNSLTGSPLNRINSLPMNTLTGTFGGSNLNPLTGSPNSLTGSLKTVTGAPINPLTGSQFHSINPLTGSPLNPIASINSSVSLSTRPPLPPRLNESPRDGKSLSGSDRDSLESDKTSPRRRVIRPPAADFIKPDLFQKNFQKISDLVRPTDLESIVHLKEPTLEREARPRSPMIPQQKNKISINLMESIESETSIDSPDKEFANLDLNDLDESNNIQNDTKTSSLKDKDSPKSDDESERSTSNLLNTSQSNESKKSPKLIDLIPQIRVPKLDLSKDKFSDEDSKKNDDWNKSRNDSIEIKSPVQKISPTVSTNSEIKSPRYDAKNWSSPLSSFKPLNKTVITSLKSSDSSASLGKGLGSPRLDGVILSQGKSNSDNVVVVYQFEQDESKTIKSPYMPDVGREKIERNKTDVRRRLELSLQKDLESIRIDFTARERRMRSELQEELKGLEEKFLLEKKMRLNEQAERHRKEMDEAISTVEQKHQESLKLFTTEMEERRKRDIEAIEKKHRDDMAKLDTEYRSILNEKSEKLERENERALSDLKEQLQITLNRERQKIVEENRVTIDNLREEQTARVTELRNDYRAEIERLRTQHACHLEEVRTRLVNMRSVTKQDEKELQEKYKCLKEKYATLKHDVKKMIERRHKRRERSMTTGSETEKSNSHKQTQSAERCKELNETSVQVVIEAEPCSRNNNQSKIYNDNETSYSESNALKSSDNNNEDFKVRKEQTLPQSGTQARNKRSHRGNVAFREPVGRRDKDGTNTDCQDSSDATTADEKPKESTNGHSRRRCFTRLKSASTSRLNYSPKRGEGWSSPLESLRQQLRKLDDLEEQFPDLACQPAYTMRYPFAEFGGVPTPRADTAELEFVRHRALVEREGMRRARAVLKNRRAALRESRASLSPHRAPSEERETTELEVALHRARALLGEKEIRLRHIERALKKLQDAHPTTMIQEATTSEASSGSETAEVETGGAVLRSLRALHADVRDIWRALDMRKNTTSPETSSCNAASTSHPRMTLSAPNPKPQDADGGITERARDLRAWLQTAQ